MSKSLRWILIALVGLLVRDASAQVDCQKLAQGMASGQYTADQQQQMATVYSRECAPAVPEAAPSLNFTIRNNTGNTLDVTFKSENRDSWWPGGDQVYILSNGEVHSYSLSCFAGERICYGASIRDSFLIERYWGAGAHHDYSCSNCCYVCGPNGETGVIGLTP